MNTTISAMKEKISRKSASILKHLIPVLWEDSNYVAFNKPPRVDLDVRAYKRGPTLINLMGEAARVKDIEVGEDGLAELLPLILPERSASGLALYAKNTEAARRFAEWHLLTNW